MIPEPSKSTDATAAASRGPRQVIRFTSLADVIATAKTLYEAQCLPRGVDRWEKLVPMLLAGAELGLGIMQTLKSITPPINGQCNLYGDMGLALVRSSGQLQKLIESIEGQGEDRRAICVIKRIGYEEKTFTYTLDLAKKLKSYRGAYEIDPKTKQPKGGPWYEDCDNMLMWRARWRAIRSEFTDVLAAMSGAEEEEQSITVEVTNVTHNVLESPPTPQLPASLTVPEAILKELSRIKKLLVDQSDETRASKEWSEYLAGQGQTSAKGLTAEQAEVMCEHFGRKVDPFGYPQTSTPPPQECTPTPGPAA